MEQFKIDVGDINSENNALLKNLKDGKVTSVFEQYNKNSQKINYKKIIYNLNSTKIY